MASRTKGGLLTCTATSSLVLLSLGLAVIAIGVIVPAQVNKKLDEGVSRNMCNLQAAAGHACMCMECRRAGALSLVLTSADDICPLQIWDSVVWTPTSPHDTDGEAAAT